NKEKIENLAALETRLEFIFSSGNRPLYVKAHEKVLYQDFINAINTAKKAGIQTICAIPQRL
ncbi:MAG: hypothetical protein GY950_21195, partial [bacterium]|nr:hypothetical protein [bacterium]